MKKIYELVRNQKVAVWAGAGISLYAGYPTGAQLRDIIIAGLSKEEQEIVKGMTGLAELADEIIKLHDGERTYLLDIVEKHFQSIPPVSSGGVHELIAAIPHFHALITTNYDELFEKAFTGNIDVVVTDEELKSVTSNRPRLFKVHGDFWHREQIILSGEDYLKFFEQQTDNLVWASIMQYMATHHVLFVGYNLNDPNVKYTFDKVSRKLASNPNRAFFVAPGLPAHHVKYLKRKNISYIDKTAEQFFPALIRSMNRNIVKDFHAGHIDAEILRRYMANYKKLPVLKSKPGKYELQGIAEEDGIPKEIFKFRMEGNRDFFNQFNDYLDGKGAEELVVPPGNFVKSVLKSGPITIYEGGRADGTLTLKKVPMYEGAFEIAFEDGFEADNIPVKVYGGNIGTVKVNYHGADIELQVDLRVTPPHLTFNYHTPAVMRKVKQGIELYELVSRLASGAVFTVPIGDKALKNKLPHSAEFEATARKTLEVFEQLRGIENFYKVKFKDVAFKELHDATIDRIEELFEHAVTGKKEIEFKIQVKSSVVTLDDTTRHTLDQIQKGLPLIIKSRDNARIGLLGINIDRGIRIVTITDPVITNYDAVINNETSEVIIQSRCGTAILSFERKNNG